MHAESLQSWLTFETLWPIACQTPLSLEFSRQEYWSGLPYPLPRDLPDPGIDPALPTLADQFLITNTTCKAHHSLLIGSQNVVQ